MSERIDATMTAVRMDPRWSPWRGIAPSACLAWSKRSHHGSAQTAVAISGPGGLVQKDWPVRGCGLGQRSDLGGWFAAKPAAPALAAIGRCFPDLSALRSRPNFPPGRLVAAFDPVVSG